jgi:dimethylaniline monooxygenase (N-oxide forming)
MFFQRWAITKLIEAYFKRSIPLQKHGMVPDYSFSFAMSSCLIAMLPEGFYDRVDEGSIVLKNSKRFSFYNDGIILEDANECIKSDIVILATGFRGDQKLRDIFIANWCRNIVAGSSDTSVPLYRYRLNIYFVQTTPTTYICNINKWWKKVS